MSTRRNTGGEEGLSRLTIDISKKTHTRLKAMASIEGKSMRGYVSELIRKAVYKKVPNKETLRAIENVEKGKDLVKAKDVLDLFDKLGI